MTTLSDALAELGRRRAELLAAIGGLDEAALDRKGAIGDFQCTHRSGDILTLELNARVITFRGREVICAVAREARVKPRQRLNRADKGMRITFFMGLTLLRGETHRQGAGAGSLTI